MAVSRETAARNKARLIEHMRRMDAGEIPEGTPFKFEHDGPSVDDRGLPSWFGPGWKPTKAGQVTVSYPDDVQSRPMQRGGEEVDNQSFKSSLVRRLMLFLKTMTRSLHENQLNEVIDASELLSELDRLGRWHNYVAGTLENEKGRVTRSDMVDRARIG